MNRNSLNKAISIFSICFICFVVQNCSNEEISNANTDIDSDTVLNAFDNCV